MTRTSLGAALSLLYLSACGVCRRDKARTPERVSIAHGIWGNVNFSKGNLMPGASCPSGTIEPVRREVRIHALAKTSDVSPDPSRSVFFTSVSTPLIATVTSVSDGFFQADLPAGSYSVFVLEDGKLYANGFGSDGIKPAKVDNAPVEVAVDINYQASY